MIREVYNELKSSCNSEEQNRIEQEIDLFVRRKWERLVIASLDLLKDLSGQPVLLGGSTLDSYFLRKAFDPTSIDSKLLLDEKAKGVLFNDALRLNIRIIRPLSLIDVTEDLRKVDACIDAVYKKYNLFVRQSIIDEHSQIVAFSENQISDESFEMIINEKKESTLKEAEILHKALIIKIEIVNGI